MLAALAMLIATPLGHRRSRSACSAGAGRGAGTANVAHCCCRSSRPELVFAVGLFLLFTTAFEFIGLGTTAQAIGHVTFSLSWVVLIVRGRLATIGRDVEEAAADLGAPPWHVVRRVLLPLLVPAMAASLLIAFALSIDDFVVSQYLASGADTTTVPMRIYAQARGGADPGAQRAGDDHARRHAARARARLPRLPRHDARRGPGRLGHRTARELGRGIDAGATK